MDSKETMVKGNFSSKTLISKSNLALQMLLSVPLGSVKLLFYI